MKRRCFVGLSLLCVLICALMCFGCQAEPSIQKQKQLTAAELVLSLDTDVVIRMGEQEYQGTVRYDPSQTASLVLDQPEELKGLSCFWQGDHFQMTYQGISVQSKECPLLDSSFASLLIHVLNRAGQTGSLTASGENIFQGIQDGIPFTITARPDGTMQSIEIPRFDFTASFGDTQIQ